MDSSFPAKKRNNYMLKRKRKKRNVVAFQLLLILLSLSDNRLSSLNLDYPHNIALHQILKYKITIMGCLKHVEPVSLF